MCFVDTRAVAWIEYKIVSASDGISISLLFLWWLSDSRDWARDKGNDSIVYDKDVQETRISWGGGDCKEIVVGGLAQYSEVCMYVCSVVRFFMSLQRPTRSKIRDISTSKPRVSHPLLLVVLCWPIARFGRRQSCAPRRQRTMAAGLENLHDRENITDDGFQEKYQKGSPTSKTFWLLMGSCLEYWRKGPSWSGSVKSTKGQRRTDLWACAINCWQVQKGQANGTPNRHHTQSYRIWLPGWESRTSKRRSRRRTFEPIWWEIDCCDVIVSQSTELRDGRMSFWVW